LTKSKYVTIGIRVRVIIGASSPPLRGGLRPLLLFPRKMLDKISFENYKSDNSFQPEVNFGKTKVSLASAFDMTYFQNMLIESTKPSLRNHWKKSEYRYFFKYFLYKLEVKDEQTESM
jgi:hypothetical protein